MLKLSQKFLKIFIFCSLWKLFYFEKTSRTPLMFTFLLFFKYLLLCLVFNVCTRWIFVSYFFLFHQTQHFLFI